MSPPALDLSPNPSGLCMCGCGQPAPLAKETRTARGQVEGQPARFRRGHNMKTPEGRAMMAARGRALGVRAKLVSATPPPDGRKIDREGYVLVKAPGHPLADCQNYVREHRLVMEARLGRVLTSQEVVHHVNGDHADNRIENLWLFPSNGAHHAWHKMLRGCELRTLMPAIRL